MIKVLHKAFDLLETIALDKERVYTLTELAGLIDEKATTCSNIVKTLCERGYMEHVQPKGYRLGPMARGLDPFEALDRKLMAAADGEMHALVTRLGASGVLAVLKRGKKKILNDYRSDSVVVVNKSIRADEELYSTSTGLVLTSEGGSLPAEGTPDCFGTAEEFERMRRSVRASGYVALDSHPELFETAAGVYVNGRLYAAVGVFLPKYKVVDKQLIINETLAAAERIAEKLGGLLKH